ncbi:MAG: dienelactone hydrolase family protein [Armatimonadaceae bacterium]
MQQEYINLYDEFTHGDMSRREFMDRLTRLAGSSALAAGLVPILENNYANAQTVPPSDSRLVTESVEFDGATGKVKAYRARLKDKTEPMPGVIVIHENRGLNPHIEDVARRAALEGFLAVAPDALSPLGGTPKDADEARGMFGKLDYDKTVQDFVAAVKYLKSDKMCNGNVGCVGFCWGGAMANQLAVNAPDLKAAVAFYGRQPKTEDVPKIKSAVQLHYAGLDERVNEGAEAYVEALKKANVKHEMYLYEGANHAFHNDTNAARYDAKAARLAWERTIKFLKENLT